MCEQLLGKDVEIEVLTTSTSPPLPLLYGYLDLTAYVPYVVCTGELP
jgi:hypothetical protein